VGNLLTNGDFEQPGGTPSSLSGAAVSGASAAPDWTTRNNSQGTTATDILASTAPEGGKQMLHVCTTGQHNGIVQVFGPQGTGPTKVKSSALVYVLRGQVGMGTGNGGDTSDRDALSTTVDQWELLQAANGISPANEFIVYATDPAGACFYVDGASVTAVPALSIIGQATGEVLGHPPQFAIEVQGDGFTGPATVVVRRGSAGGGIVVQGTGNLIGNVMEFSKRATNVACGDTLWADATDNATGAVATTSFPVDCP
jgi:hypothetical protein